MLRVSLLEQLDFGKRVRNIDLYAFHTNLSTISKIKLVLKIKIVN